MVLQQAAALNMLAGNYGWFSSSSLLSQPNLAQIFGPALNGVIGLKVPWTMRDGPLRQSFHAQWQASYAANPNSVYGIPRPSISERRYNTVWRIARGLHDMEELKIYCFEPTRNASVFTRIAQNPQASCTNSSSLWPDTREQLCCILARADLGHNVDSMFLQTPAQRQDRWWSYTYVLSRLMWNRTSIGAEGDAGFGWSTSEGWTVDAFQIVNVVGMSVNIVGSYGLNGDPTRPVQMNTSQLIWMAGQTNRPSNDVMITKRLLEDTTGLVGVINSIAGECTAVEHEWKVL